MKFNVPDIQMAFKESLCESCGDLCGDVVNWRVSIYQGQEYTIPPKAMIIEGILKVLMAEALKMVNLIYHISCLKILDLFMRLWI